MVRSDKSLDECDFSKSCEKRSVDVGEILGAGGLVSQFFSGFEYRPEQVEMACAVREAFESNRCLAVEAGTGVGKSFSYLVPAIELACRGAGRVLISTFTITLQEQLINKDIPFLADCMLSGRSHGKDGVGGPCTFTAVLAKGRGNYLCKRRLEFALRRQKGLFDKLGTELAVISDWANQSSDGSLSDLSFVPRSSLWDMVKSEHGNCLGRKCPHFSDCFYLRARRRLDNADIIVANHALMFSDLVLKQQGASVLPDYKYIVVDEAHNIEHVAENHFGIDISERRVKFLLDGLYNPRTHKGLLSYTKDGKAADIVEIVVRAAKESRKFFRQVGNWYEENRAEFRGRWYKGGIDENVCVRLGDLRLGLVRMAKECDDADEKFEIMRFTDRTEALIQDLKNFLAQNKTDYVYWVESGSRKSSAVRLRAAAVNVGPDVKRCLFDKYKSVALTSATLSSGSSKGTSGFEFFAGRIGLSDYSAIKLGSPFDYEKQVVLYIEKALPSPNDAAFTKQAAEAIKKYIQRTKGRAFVLFTSYAMLDKIAGELSCWLAENNIEMLRQGAGVNRTQLLERFGSVGDSVLFGTDSFWQGVDVQGDALSNVIIIRLPFGVPDKPLLSGRLEQIRSEGGNPFFDYQLPLAVIKFKQGFGRLIRSRTDKGIVVVLDSRIINKRYGVRFLSAIPRCKVEIVSAKTIY